MRKWFIVYCIVTVPLASYFIYLHPWWSLSLILLLPSWLVGLYDLTQTRHTIKKNYPLFGRLRYVMEELRPKVYQYFVESDTDGTPINRINRSVVYQRAKRVLRTKPFGTQVDVYEPGYEWINHSMYPLSDHEVPLENLRVEIGSKHCQQKYNASILNISAMSYGSLSGNAVEALNRGASLGGFAQNTGEGSISDYHLKHGGHIIWQIGTGYFGARDHDGNFSDELFSKNAKRESVKMIEIKLSQGAKPGHGGILPAKKNTPEIARIRGVKPYTAVISPPGHTEFNNSEGLIKFIQRLRDLSGGKPIGIKLCFGKLHEFEDLCIKMKEMDNYPDYIVVDGGEGGTGAAPLEFSDSLGTPMTEGLVLVSNLLNKYGLKDQIKLIVSGKIITGFHIVRALSLGADACYSARAMMLALGCIQALICNTNKCPAGIATQDKSLSWGLDVQNKGTRINNFHQETVHSVREILGSAGVDHPSKLSRADIFRRVSPTKVKSLEEIYPHQRTALTN
ncbi:putative membrane protein [Halobacteriovorax marinus SJ]|uniref:Membrane protein n=1 Tax=Halobacteriovorax marinus (strain ATCC BAA-682 / DSM 15412 / SJ) TaxID=862908 RepID=E1WY17_HALMS|nr:FMN-binding glutamate synthase family protein [Halobacteriovorax marinus]CBW27572.1 putative membrane protein [Halobacteriovorax marinus SJ]